MEGLLTFLVIAVVVTVIVPFTLAVLLVRQVLRTPFVRRLRGATTRRSAPPVAYRSQSVPYVSGRYWRGMVKETHAARQRFAQAVSELQPGPLQQTLVAATPEVDAAVGEALRLALQGDRAERAQREVLTALEHQRRRARTSGDGADPVLAAATRAQHDSADRLAAAVRQSSNSLELVVARLHELTAHTLELATLAATPRLSAAASIAERLSALREATAEVELAAIV